MVSPSILWPVIKHVGLLWTPLVIKGGYRERKLKVAFACDPPSEKCSLPPSIQQFPISLTLSVDKTYVYLNCLK